MSKAPRVLVTRPEDKAGKTCAALLAQGYEPVAMPLYRPRNFPEKARHMLADNMWSALAVTSTQALAGLDIARDAPGLRQCPVFAVGERTARAAKEAGFERIFTGAGNGEALAGLVAQDPSLFRTAPLLYLAGSPRSPLFERRLAALEIPFETATVYVMQAIDYTGPQIAALLRDQPPAAILFYSYATAHRFFALGAADHLAALSTPPALLCLSAHVAEAVPRVFRQHTRIAAKPDEAALFATLAALTGQERQ